MNTILIKLLLTGLLIASAVLADAQDIRDRNGVKTGSVDENGSIRDKNGIKIGTAKDVDKKKTAVLFFFSYM